MNLEDFIKEKGQLLLDAEKDFLAAVAATEKAVFSEILKILRKLLSKDGKLVKDKINKTRAKQLVNQLLDVVQNSTLEKKVDLFLTNFDDVERINQQIYDLQDINLNNQLKEEIGVFKTLQIERITEGILGDAQLTVNYINPIRDIILNGIATQSKLSDVESALRDYVKGSATQSAGTLRRYARQIALDSINQFDGQTNDIIRDAHNLDGWLYVNPLVDKSRQNCIDLVNGKGRFEKYAIQPGLYRVADIPAIIRSARKGRGSGWNPSTTPATWATYRGGYQCNHQVIYVRLEDFQ